jgi:hypothetical protein
MRPRWIGRWLIGVGAIHTLFGVVAFRAPLRALLDAGIVNALSAREPMRNLAFWFLVAGVMIALVGTVVDALEQATRGTVPKVVGWTLLLTALVGIVLAPASGFWLLLPAAVGALRATGVVTPSAPGRAP